MQLKSLVLFACVIICTCTSTLSAQLRGRETSIFSACCMPDGTCTRVTSWQACASSGGEWQGEGTSCATRGGVICENTFVGACCFPEGFCSDGFSEIECEKEGGEWQGLHTSCDFQKGQRGGSLVICEPQFGACCFPDGYCEQTFEFDCFKSGGSWQGLYTYCGAQDDRGNGGVICEVIPPDNDECINAIHVEVPSFTYGDTYGANPDLLPCRFFRGGGGGGSVGGVWYTVTGTGNYMGASVCLNDFGFNRGSFLPGQITVLCGDCDHLNCVAQHSGSLDFCNLRGEDSLNVDWCSELGREYFIFIEIAEPVPFVLDVIDFEKSCQAEPCGIENDLCENAIELFPGNAPAFGTTNGATPDDVESCTNINQKIRGFGGEDVWYKVTGTGTVLDILMCSNNLQRGGVRAAVDVYCGDCENLFCVTGTQTFVEPCDFIRGSSESSVLQFCSEEGREYFIRVSQFSGPLGDFIIGIEDTEQLCRPEPCGNLDFCFVAQPICPTDIYVGNTFTATNEYLDHGAPFSTIFFCGMHVGLYDVWYEYTPGSNGMVFVRVEGPPTDFIYAIYDDCPENGGEMIDCNITRHFSVIAKPVVAHHTYYIRVAAYSSLRGEFEINLIGPACAPELP